MPAFTVRRRGECTWFPIALTCLSISTASCASVRQTAPSAPDPQPAAVLAATAPPPGGCELPARERTQEIGCYLTAVQPLGVLSGTPVFWHIYRYPSRSAAEAERPASGTVVELSGQVLLYTIGEEAWRPAGGEKLAAIGPLPYTRGVPYTARYMEAVFTSGMLTTAHRHSGAEAWYLFEGAQCLETPDGYTVVHAGQSALVGAGPPMVLRHVGTATRRSVLLVLHESSEPWITRAGDWTPRGICPA